MSLNSAPSANRIHIGIFGKRNAGKSSIINAITDQNLAIVSDIKGTTTDPVQKAMELLPLGPVVLIDTPGLDDKGELGALRIQKAYQVLNKTDIAVLVVDSGAGLTAEDKKILDKIQDKKIPYVVVFNKSDLYRGQSEMNIEKDESLLGIVPSKNCISVSAITGEHIWELKELLAKQIPSPPTEKHIVSDLIQPNDFVVLVIPIDSAAPKGRLILPQQQTIRDILEAGAAAISIKETELSETLARLGTKPSLVITDSQAFEKVAADVPQDIPLTSFSILFARYKGNLKTVVQGAAVLDTLQDNDTILICEGCTHHRQCEDIGTVKLPGWIRKYTLSDKVRSPKDIGCGMPFGYTRKELLFEFTSGTEFPADLSKYRLIIHCGGCTLNEREMKYRMQCAMDQGIPMTNYGTAIAHMHGILNRSIEPFPELHLKD